MTRLLSQIPLGTINGIGPMGNKSTGSVVNTLLEFELVISNIIGIITIAAGLYFLFQLINAGIGWISAGGDKGQLQTAQKKIINSIMGLVIVIAAYAVAGVIGRVLGLQLLRPSILIINLHP